MKNRNLLYILISILTFGVVLYACKNPGDGVTINVNTYVLKAPTMVQFINAVKDAPNQPKDFPITIGGRDADKIVNSSNEPVFSAKDGRVMLALKKGVEPSMTNPIEFTVAAEIPGFTPATKTFVITSDIPTSAVVQVIEYANPVPGTTAKVQEDALQGGVNVAPIVVQTSAPSGTTDAATVSIAAGTQFLDANGQPILASRLESRVVQYGAESPESLASFPGGFEIANIIGEDGRPIEGGVAFVTAGFLAMDLYAGGTEVKGFSKPIEVEVGVSSTLQNPETGETIKAGDQVPVWSLNDKTGEWKYESTATIEKDAQGKLSASFLASHLSYWNLDWGLMFCNNTLGIKFNAPGAATSNYRVMLEGQTGFKSSYANIAITDGQVLGNIRVPATGMSVSVYNMEGVLLTKTDFAPACSREIVVNIPPVTNLDIVNVSMTLQGICPNQPVNGNISSWATVYEKGAPLSAGMTVYLNNGKLDLKLKNNTEYSVTALYGNNYRTANIKFVKDNFTFPGTMTGTAIYDQPTNTVNVLAQFPLPNCR
jgi:hypothetical protein